MLHHVAVCSRYFPGISGIWRRLHATRMRHACGMGDTTLASALPDCGEAKMASKQVTLVVCAVLFTAINLLVLAANWSIAAHAKVGGMDYSALEVDADFRRAIRDVVSQMDQSYWRRNNAFRGAVVEVVEGCHLPYRDSRSLRCRGQSF